MVNLASDARRQNACKVALLLATTAILTALIFRHTTPMNGPWYGHANWRHLRAVYVFGWMSLAATPLLAAIVIYELSGHRIHPLLLMPLLMLSAMAMKLVAADIMSDPPSLKFIPYLISHNEATSYYTDAAALNARFTVSQWLTVFPDVMSHLHLHSMTKPPGAILYYTLFIRTKGYSDRTAMISGITLGALATLSIPMCWLLIRTMLRPKSDSGPNGLLADRARAGRVAFFGAALLTMFPGFILFFPVGDPVFIIFSCALIALWIVAIERDRFRYSCAAGVVLFVATVATYNILVLGFFLAVYPLIARGRGLKRSIAILFKHALPVLCVCAALYLLMFLMTGFDPIATFRSAWANQHALLRQHADERPYPDTIWNDLLFFALGTGCLASALALFWPITGAIDGVKRFWQDRVNRVVLLGFAQLLLVAVVGLLQSETARVWNFMYPLILLPAGLELASYPRTQRLIAFACAAWMFLIICKQMAFV